MSKKVRGGPFTYHTSASGPNIEMMKILGLTTCSKAVSLIVAGTRVAPTLESSAFAAMAVNRVDASILPSFLRFWRQSSRTSGSWFDCTKKQREGNRLTYDTSADRRAGICFIEDSALMTSRRYFAISSVPMYLRYRRS